MLDQILTGGFLVSLLASTIRLATPIMVPALGQLYTQRAGILNLGVEGNMLMGAVAGFAVAYLSGSLWLGLLAGMVTGVLWSAIMAWLSIVMKANQVIAGLGMNILAGGLAAYTYRVIFGVQSLPPSVECFQSLHIPVLSDIPVLGPILFQHNLLVYLSFLLVPVTWFILEKTVFGLKVKAVGEHPRAADSKGINVGGIRFASVLIGGLYAGAAGAFMTIAYLNSFTEAVISGRGYIAVAVVVFARFMPVRSMWGALLFGFASALQMRLQALGVDVANQIMLMLPYVMTIIALIFASNKAEFPSAYTITLASIARFTRTEMLEVLSSDYMLLAESKGISGSPLILQHALRNALIPIVTVLAPLIVDLMTGSLVVEKIFSIPGVGSLLVTAIQSNDYNVVIALSFIYSAMYIGIMLLVDILYGVIDPRIRVAKKGD